MIVNRDAIVRFCRLRRFDWMTSLTELRHRVREFDSRHCCGKGDYRMSDAEARALKNNRTFLAEIDELGRRLGTPLKVRL